ncbi:YncE family protein [Mariniflexile gromovii]|uniref:YncE family protein n=1 Tax=Mariniflexile gromovii TaxID=362523 RepID=A0ABS4BRS7_9FLAO|nr:YncE family protein [Mariniflexile gromovii]MBP0903284.1 YncE family protein [Mariniflexile gromovii]
MKMNKFTLLALAIGLIFTSCTNDDDPVDEIKGVYDNGMLIVNEGNFFQGNASVSYVSNDYSVVENNIFNNVNSRLLGDTAQSIAFTDELAYIVVNVSQKIEVVDRYSFTSIATIDAGLTNPRYMAFANGKGYVTDWGDGGSALDDVVAVIDLATNTVESSISVGEGPEQILAKNGKLYVSHKGGWSTNNIVSVIDAATKTVQTITVNDVPDEMVFNQAGELVVLCEGATQYDANWNPTGHTDGSLVRINVANNSIVSTLIFNNGIYPSLMAYADGKLYYQAGSKIYTINDAATSLPTESIINDSFYGLAVNDNMLYGTKTDFTAGTGDLLIYDLSSKSLTTTKSLKVGAAKIYFN